jgi:hypothetical protein
MLSDYSSDRCGDASQGPFTCAMHVPRIAGGPKNEFRYPSYGLAGDGRLQ